MVEIDAEGKRTYALSREQLGVMADYWFCIPCNRDRTRPCDEEYARWAPTLLNALHEPESSVNTLEAIPIDFDPGAFACCLWAWFLAVGDGLRDRVSHVAAAVMTGEPVKHVGYPRVFLAATRELQFSMSIHHHSGGITAPPYAALIVNSWMQASRRRRNRVPHLPRNHGAGSAFNVRFGVELKKTRYPFGLTSGARGARQLVPIDGRLEWRERKRRQRIERKAGYGSSLNWALREPPSRTSTELGAARAAVENQHGNNG